MSGTWNSKEKLLRFEVRKTNSECIGIKHRSQKFTNTSEVLFYKTNNNEA